MATAQNAAIDENGVRTLLGVSNDASTTILRVQADPSTHAVSVIDAATGSDYGRSTAKRDQNSQPVMIAVSSADGVTPIELYLDSVTQALLIQST